MGLKPMAMSTSAFTRLCFSMVVDDMTSGFTTRYEARKKVNETLSAARLPTTRRTERAPTQQIPDRATWGLLPEHQAGLKRAMTVVEGRG